MENGKIDREYDIYTVIENLRDNFVNINSFEDFRDYIDNNFDKNWREVCYSKLMFLYSDALSANYVNDAQRVLKCLTSSKEKINIEISLPPNHLDKLFDYDIFTTDGYKDVPIPVYSIFSSIVSDYKRGAIELNIEDVSGVIRLIHKCAYLYLSDIFVIFLDCPILFNAMYKYGKSIKLTDSIIISYFYDMSEVTNLSTFIESMKDTLMANNRSQINDIIKTNLSDFIMYDILAYDSGYTNNGSYDYSKYFNDDRYDDVGKIKNYY